MIEAKPISFGIFGPASPVVDNAIAAFDGTARRIQSRAVTIDDSGSMVIPDGSSLSLQEDITFTGATTENQIKFPDNLANALSFQEAGNIYQQFITTNGSEAVYFLKDVGIGLPAPLTTVHVLGTSPRIRVDDYASARNPGFEINSGGYNLLSMTSDTTSGNSLINVPVGASDLTITTAGDLIITNRVNIGGGSGAKFTVSGDSDVSDTDPRIRIIDTTPTAGSSRPGIEFHDESGLMGYLEMQDTTPSVFKFRDSSDNVLVTIGTAGNLGLGVVTFGADMAGGMAIALGTAPTGDVADQAAIYVADRGGTAGKASVHIRAEDGTTHVFGDLVGIGTASPIVELDVNGSIDIASTGNITQNGVNLIKQDISTDAIYIGKLAGDEATGNDSIFIGEDAGRYSTGDDNVYIGEDSGSSAINSGGLNVGIGNGTLGAQTSGTKNVAVGASSLTTLTSGHSNMAVGISALQFTTSNSNVAMGAYALQSNTVGFENIGVGSYTLSYHTTGKRNTAIGVNAGKGVSAQSIASDDGVYIGNLAGTLVTTGDRNTAVGKSAMDNLSSGAANIALGYGAGDVLTTGSRNIYIGYNIDARAVDESSTLNIGNLIFGTGVDAEGTSISSGNVGIRTPTFGASMVGGMAIALGTAPTGDVADQAAIYVADIVAGNTAPHFRTENGAVIKLYQCAKADYNNWGAFTDVVDALVAMGIFDAA